MITENVSTLKINKLTKAQYERELAAGRIDENALYLTPDNILSISEGGTNATTEKDARTNLGFTYGTEVPTEAPSTGDGSIYFFEDELTPVAITEGGTGATDATTALANLGITDYIVEQGTSGIWTYRKWASGNAECWTMAPKTSTGIATTSLMSGYYTYLTINLPFTFTTISGAFANAKTGTGLGWAITAAPSNSQITIYVVGNQNSTTVTYSCHVMGTWK